MRSAPGPLRRSDRGSAAVELAILVPGLVLILGLMVAGGRLWLARTTVTEAAYSAARAASLARTPSEAAVEGTAAARRTLATEGLVCGNPTIRVSTAAFSVPVGRPATVTTAVSCTVAFSDVLLPGMPGSLAIDTTAASALDTYRAR